MKHPRLLFLLSILLIFSSCSQKDKTYKQQVIEILKDSILILVKDNLNKAPITVTSDPCSRSTGGIHDFYSEGDYWWPDSSNLEGPYIKFDGKINPNNFTAHRKSLIRFSEIVGNLTSAFIITKDSIYAKKVIDHCKAWFLDEDTKMNPNLLFTQAVEGRFTGRGIGIIDGIHFLEVVQSLIVLERHGMISTNDMKEFRKWFSSLLNWIINHQYGYDAMVHPNNHGTCLNLQLAMYSIFTNNDLMLVFSRKNFKNTVLPNQMALNGSFPLELKRTRPLNYSLFNLDAMVMNCLILSDSSNNFWDYTTLDGKNILLGLEFMKPFIEDKSKWPQEPDIMYWDNFPVAQLAFLFGAIVFNKPGYFELWKSNKHFFDLYEVKRNLPIRNPLIWLDYFGFEN